MAVRKRNLEKLIRKKENGMVKSSSVLKKRKILSFVSSL